MYIYLNLLIVLVYYLKLFSTYNNSLLVERMIKVKLDVYIYFDFGTNYVIAKCAMNQSRGCVDRCLFSACDLACNGLRCVTAGKQAMPESN